MINISVIKNLKAATLSLNMASTHGPPMGPIMESRGFSGVVTSWKLDNLFQSAEDKSGHLD